MKELEDKINKYQNEIENENEKIKEMNEKEKEKIEKEGIYLYETHMKFLLKIDEFVDIDEERKKVRKEIVIKIQQKLDLIEELQNKFKLLKK